MTEKNLHIIRAATELFLKDGFHGTQMNGIAEKAQVSKRTLYKYYRSKEEVYSEVLNHYLRQLRDFYRVEYRADQEFLSELDRLIREKIAYVLHPDFLNFSRLLLMEQIRGNNPILFIAAEALSIRALFGTWLKQNVDAGKFQSSLPLDVLAEYYHQAIEGMVFWPAVMGSREEFSPAEIDHIVTVIANSFRHETLVHRKD